MSTDRTSIRPGMSPWIGWGLSTLALLFLNKKHKGNRAARTPEPSSLHAKGTKLGEVIPVVLGTCLVKQPLITYWGDFSSRIYTEEYGMHTKFNWGNLIPSVLLAILAFVGQDSKVTGTAHVKGATVQAGHYSGQVTSDGYVTGTTVGEGAKNTRIVMAVISLLLQLLTALFTQHAGRTTIQKGFKYYVGWQQIVCWSHPNARLKKIYMKEKLIWSGDEPASNHTDGSYFNIHINDENLFGGADEEGGFVGDIHVYFGNPNQPGDPWMKNQMTADSVQAELRGYTPAYRPYISVVIPTAYIGKRANIPEMWFEIEVIPTALGAETPKIGDDANPVEILHEIVINNDWGLAERSATIAVDALKEMGRELAEEQMGLSCLLDSKQSARDLTNDICSHINAVRFSEMPTGRIEYRLIRPGYDESKVLTVTESNCSSIEFTRQDWINTVSEISVTYTDRNNLYEAGTISSDDPANIEILNGVKTVKSYDMPYFTTAENALCFAQRENNAQGYPLAVLHLKCNRQMYSVRIGDVLRVSFPSYGIDQMFVRVTNINLNTLNEGTIEIDALEDVFSLGKTSYGFGGSTEWQPDRHYPTGVEYFWYFEVPWEMLRSDDTYVYAMAAKPDSYTDVWNLWRKRFGTDFVATASSTSWSAFGQLVWNLDKDGPVEDSTGMEVIDLFGMDDVKDKILLEADPDDPNSAREGRHIVIVGDEVIAFSTMELLPNGHWKLGNIIRGVYDTVPQDHGTGERVYFISPANIVSVTAKGPVCKAGTTTTEQYNITTASPDGVEEFDAAKASTLTTTRRAERPTPPGRVRLETHLIPPSRKIARAADDLIISWSPRDKNAASAVVSQDDDVDYTSGLPYTTPVGMDYFVEIWVDGKMREQYVSTAEFYKITWGQRCLAYPDLTLETEIQLYCVLGGLECYQRQTKTFMWTIPPLVGFAVDKPAADALIASMDAGSMVTVPPTAYNSLMYVPYANGPIVLIGTPTTTPGPGDILNNDGTYWTPTSLAVYENGATGVVKPFDSGYTFETQFYEAGISVSPRYYRWNDIIFEEVTKDGKKSHA